MVHPLEALPGTHDTEQSERDAAIISRTRRGVPGSLAELDALALSVVAVYRTPPVDRRRDLVDLVESFLAERSAWAGESDPPRILSTAGRRARGSRRV
jgi:hypothetical protein